MILISLLTKYKESILYLIFGGLTFVINIVTYTLCTRIFNIDILISNCISWIISVLFAYITNKVFVFESKISGIKNIFKEFYSFVWCRIFSGIVELIIIFIMATLAGINDLIVKIITNIVVITLNYFASKLIIFKHSNESKKYIT